MGPFWVSSSENPHKLRRELMLKKYPQIKNLMGFDPNFKLVVIVLVIIQFVSMCLVNYVTNYWILFFAGYCFNGVINHSLLLSIHDIAHNQAFGYSKPLANKLFGIFANLPIGLPVCMLFKHYHSDHHRYQGDDHLDTDLPSKFEMKYLTTSIGKLIWIICQPISYAIRPILVNPPKINKFIVLNFIAQFMFDLIIIYYLGLKPILYLVLSLISTMGLHPLGGHFITEHYILLDNQIKNDLELKVGKGLVPDTFSYYGPLNLITFNVGYHVEHHDFPNIPSNRLSEVRKIAPEFYENLYSHSSWTTAIIKYIFNSSIGPGSRVRRSNNQK